jgi:hypothetical protein
MTPAQKGERYARIFRKAGALIGNRSSARALKALKEGAALAKEWGDGAMLRRFEAEIARLGEPPEKEPLR